MSKNGWMGMFAAVAVAITGAASTAEAQFSGAVCENHGGADLTPGIPGDAGPTNLASMEYEFIGDLTGCSGTVSPNTVCSRGPLVGATCANNQHSGDYVVCKNGCLLYKEIDDPSYTGPPPAPKITIKVVECTKPADQLRKGKLSGVCTGSVCVGSDTAAGTGGMFYTLVFDQETVENALAECNPTAPGILTRANFDGALGFGK